MPLDPALQFELSLRLVVGAALGAVVGLEREIHDHPAGMRTHLLVALGATLFAVISGYGYAAVRQAGLGAGFDPTRIAAQIVTGIGFLGAGAILQMGASVKGLTTAASLWATAAVGVAVGSGEYLLGTVATVLVVFSLGPLNAIIRQLRPRGSRILDMRLELATLDALGSVTEHATRLGAELSAISSRKLGKGRYELEMSLRLPSGSSPQRLVAVLGGLPSVDVIASSDSN